MEILQEKIQVAYFLVLVLLILSIQQLSGDDTAEIITDVLTAEDAGDASFNLFLDTSGTKKLSFNGIITGTSYSSTVGDLSTISVSFVTNGAITSAI